MYVFYSQQGEDTYIFKHFINKINPTGLFVELGGMNGLTYSNTKFFEDTLAFKGTIIEPTDQYYELVNNRPLCNNYKLAVNYTKGPVKIIGNYATAGLVQTMAEDFKNQWHRNSNEYFVEGEPFRDILQKSNIKYIDLLSIDVEGAELVVLKTFDFNIPVYVIVIELDNHNPEKDQECRDILNKNGFTLKKRFCINEFWVNESYFRISELYDDSIPKPNLLVNTNKFPFMERCAVPEIIKALN